MASADTAVARPPRVGFRPTLGGAGLARGAALLWISFIVLLPLAAVISRGFSDGLGHFFDAITDKEAVAAIKLTLISSAIVVAINAVMGTLIAWVLVRDEFRGKKLLNSIIDLPFALPTIVASLVLLALYGPNSPIGIHAAYTRVAVVMALLFVTLPFVIRAVQPVLMEVDREMEEAAASLGAPNHRIFRSILLPNLTPAIVAGCALAFARAIGEFGSLVLLTGNIPFKTQAASVYIFGRVQTSDYSGAAAVSVLLLAIAVGVLLAINFFALWRTRHQRA
ncbi:MAG TPA: sulfate ABC transporter permease subunit CysT [Solirubrobacterales bacterium]|jgi:sulfate/thiosulfate transport system permease protein|nr:sulfate ABC transporter permease subunit CysT [Solirubrobacterales bacterium]